MSKNSSKNNLTGSFALSPNTSKNPGVKNSIGSFLVRNIYNDDSHNLSKEFEDYASKNPSIMLNNFKALVNNVIPLRIDLLEYVKVQTIEMFGVFNNRRNYDKYRVCVSIEQCIKFFKETLNEGMKFFEAFENFHKHLLADNLSDFIKHKNKWEDAYRNLLQILEDISKYIDKNAGNYDNKSEDTDEKFNNLYRQFDDILNKIGEDLQINNKHWITVIELNIRKEIVSRGENSNIFSQQSSFLEEDDVNGNKNVNSSTQNFNSSTQLELDILNKGINNGLGVDIPDFNLSPIPHKYRSTEIENETSEKQFSINDNELEKVTTRSNKDMLYRYFDMLKRYFRSELNYGISLIKEQHNYKKVDNWKNFIIGLVGFRIALPIIFQFCIMTLAPVMSPAFVPMFTYLGLSRIGGIVIARIMANYGGYILGFAIGNILHRLPKFGGRDLEAQKKELIDHMSKPVNCNMVNNNKVYYIIYENPPLYYEVERSDLIDAIDNHLAQNTSFTTTILDTIIPMYCFRELVLEEPKQIEGIAVDKQNIRIL